MTQAPGRTLGGLARKRQLLASRLTEAAELEHALLCQYLYAFLSLKRTDAEGVTPQQLEPMRRWGASLLLIARQEMEHLGLVSNLLTAIGEAPHLSRPDFPLDPDAYHLDVPCRLEPFGLPALERFILFEMPAEPAPADRARMAALGTAALGTAAPERNSIASLYAEISKLMAEIDPPPPPGAPPVESELFIGPPGAQYATPEIIPVPIRGVQTPNHPVYDVFLTAVTDLASAQAVVMQIVEEGEGTPVSSPGSHFARFCAMYEKLREQQAADPRFKPARAVVADPTEDGAVTVASSLAVRDLFDFSYTTILLLLHRFFARTDESQREIAALQAAVFFPMMTGVLRPVGEVLTQLPAHESGAARAAPTFAYPREIALLPHKRSAWQVISGCLDSLADQAGELAADTASYGPVACARLTLVHENLVRIARDFATNMRVRP
jgi:Ferritin-like